MRRLSIALLAALVLPLSATACGSEDDEDGVASLAGDQSDDSSADSSDASADPEEQALAYAQCMRDHGVDMPDPEVDSEGRLRMQIGGGPGDAPDRATLEKATEACEDLQPRMGGNMSEDDRAEMQDRMLAFAECMRDHGIDMPDPQFDDDGGVRFGPPQGVDPDDPDFLEAQDACTDEAGLDDLGKRS